MRWSAASLVAARSVRSSSQRARANSVRIRPGAMQLTRMPSCAPGLRLHLGQHVERRLRDRVAADHVRGAEAAHRAHVHDRAALPVDEHRLAGEGREEVGALHVGVHDHVEGALVELVDGTVGGVRARVVHEDVDAAELRLGARDEGAQLLHAAHVGGHREGAAAEVAHGRRRLLEGLGLARREHDVGPVLGEAEGDGAADAAARAGDDGDLAGEGEIGDGHGPGV